MIKCKIKYCNNCKKETPHTYSGKELKSLLLWWHNIYWKCDKCGYIHIQDTAHLEDEYN